MCKKSWTMNDGGLKIELFTDGKKFVVAKSDGVLPAIPAGLPGKKQFEGKAIVKGDDVFELQKGIRIAVRNLRHAMKSEAGRVMAGVKRELFAAICQGKYMGRRPAENK